jgi:hypothetical protein
MNFVNGKIISDSECESVLERIDEMLMDTFRKPPLDVNLVINACDTIIQNIDSLDIVKRLPELGVSPVLAEMYMKQISQMLSAEAIRKRMRIELGENYEKPSTLTYSHSGATAVQTIAPLGVLFHITAGNVDGLPFISLLDGLLTGNINIVKLPKEEGGITVSLLEELFKIEPSLKEYVYIFDYSSKDIHAMRKLATVADAIIVWGGDEAVSAVRKLADPNTKVIEWGHKISFAYVTKEGASKDALEKLAFHICLTNQLFCSSCQGVLLDTDNMQDVYNFCEEFLPIFEKVCRENPFAFNAAARLFIQAEVTLQNYHRQIENKNTGIRVFRDQNCTITAQPDSKLETSIMYRNIWVKPLQRDEIIKLRPYKSYLQTAALICTEREHEELAQKLLQTGLVKISDGFEMSNYAFGEAHDGVFTLRCYTKLVSVQSYS